jgi:hypothetical protein
VGVHGDWPVADDWCWFVLREKYAAIVGTISPYSAAAVESRELLLSSIRLATRNR